MAVPVPKRTLLSALALALVGETASALPITITNTGYWIDTVGSNTVGFGNGGTPGGTVTAVFDAFTAPTAAQGTTATASYGATAVSAPVPQSTTTGEWARREFDLTAALLQPLTVVFRNGGDTASVTTGSLVGITPIPLVQNLRIDASANAFSPTVLWSLPTGTGFEIDAVQLVFYNDATNLEIGNRLTLAPTATSFTFGSLLPAGLDLTVNVRLYDLADRTLGLSDSSNYLAESRAYVNYAVAPVPEPATTALMVGGLGLLGIARLRSRRRPV